ncbi:protein O-mannose kinase-like [Saccostrea echinata]|uniref:protein O-mannose kinase-like n=1 Tax=Saccostrea echinata TaxID=191078 RepID=UPI002A8189DE|nr:protein O-mannose kinase-like [Saccostrea echinata]
MRGVTFKKNPPKFLYLFWFIGYLCACVVLAVFKLYLIPSTYESRNLTFNTTTESTHAPILKCVWSVVDNRTKCKPVCGHGYFGLYGMETCHPWLDCEGLMNINGSEKIPSSTSGSIKEVRISKWEGHDVVVKKLRNYHVGKRAHEEFKHGLQILKDFSNHSEVLQLVGYCNNVMVTEFHALADANNLEKHLQIYRDFDNVSTRFQLCLDFIYIMLLLHSGLGGKVYAHCDGNAVSILRWQYLLTDDFRLVISDVDALVDFEILNGVTKKKVCPVESRNYSVPFNAPEQHWPYGQEPFNISRMPPYDEKIDIWKIPDVCKSFLHYMPLKIKILPHLKDIHSRCKNKDPQQRPTAVEVLEEYRAVYKHLIGNHSVILIGHQT